MPKTEFVYDELKFKNKFLETSEFEVLFPKHRCKYFESVEKYITKALEMKKIKFEIDYEKCTMKVSTTHLTRDPYIIIKANEMIQLLGKGLLLEHAVKILDDGMLSDIVPIHMLASSKKVFERRRQRLLNPKIFNSLQLITKCNILIANKTACIVGDHRGLNDAKKVIIRCFENSHPAFELKELIIKKKLLRDGEEGDWERFLPKIKKTHSKRKTKSRITGNMPEEIRDRKEDIEMKTGEFYKSDKNLERMKSLEERRIKREEIRKKRAERFIAPEE